MAKYSYLSIYILRLYGTLVVSLNAIEVLLSLGIGILGGGRTSKLEGGILAGGKLKGSRVNTLGGEILYFARLISN